MFKKFIIAGLIIGLLMIIYDIGLIQGYKIGYEDAYRTHVIEVKERNKKAYEEVLKQIKEIEDKCCPDKESKEPIF